MAKDRTRCKIEVGRVLCGTVRNYLIEMQSLGWGIQFH